ncbi:type II toxin-antitoxin system VapC family toxin [Methylobacterium currus]|uniref:type II toxin-antitoxin system VapC family toxin n=1 Tax=Methylobacterium currus TaxID=2051553 RepID=UPI001E394F09|nr:type II toxin-antitoxin system VapC family toxin [Methylobacterium currus]UHC15194.1 type II toxin-antitoxin system VapC family toxin [Methylobacterium currus]
MIAVDASALLAIAFGEPEAQTFLAALAREDCVTGTSAALEAHNAVERRGEPDATAILRDLMALSNLTLLPFTAAHTFIARQAFDRYGQGRGHSASLNFGDCLCDAVAMRDDLPLLFKGNDFSTTALLPAVSMRPWNPPSTGFATS